MFLDEIEALLRSLESQQAAFTRPHHDINCVIQMMYAVSKLILNKLRPDVLGDCVKECAVAAGELLEADKIN